jgi:hypothetical protein
MSILKYAFVAVSLVISPNVLLAQDTGTLDQGRVAG